VSPPPSPGKLPHYLQQMSSTELNKMALILGDKERNSPNSPIHQIHQFTKSLLFTPKFRMCSFDMQQMSAEMTCVFYVQQNMRPNKLDAANGAFLMCSSNAR
jgi:hypothetical protein